MTSNSPFAERMRSARTHAGLSQIEASYRAHDFLPKSMWFSHGLIQRMENGSISEERADTFLIVVMARVYGCTVSELSPAASEELDRLREVLTSSLRWMAMQCNGQADLFAGAA